MSKWLEAMNAPDLGIVFNKRHYAATQSMDEEQRQNVNFNGAFGHDGPITRSVRRADESTVAFSAIVLKPGQNAGLNDEQFLESLTDFQIITRRGPATSTNSFRVYEGCAWTSIRVNSTLEQVTISADISVPTQRP